MAKELRETFQCMMGDVFTTIDQFKGCEEDAEINCGTMKIGDDMKEIWLCLKHSWVFWGYYILPEVLKDQMRASLGGGDKDA